ncbi:amidohydrolase family protein [Pontibacter sp. HSC-36F09]|uniref:N-acyl-D-amino-acid deacylase family protein n=1 Tax=Pontibacter sp. HSC-36F09 TaxID=2910966 RepID=UPI0020A22A2A|nr:amidohydrolase family protein [Pontibacter sp. HSC-36F09]MCP2044000.1 N-acyl-D-amino-acid deacylase [Pontibacter sp. HSC-36F09]
MEKMYRCTALFARFVIALFVFASCQQVATEQTRYELLISNAMVVDGTGKAAFAAHVLINGDSIALIDIDTTNTYTANRTINASGLYLTPGFIDTHAHGDPLETPDFSNFLSMGVTTICLGQDGFSPEREDLKEWMQEVDSMELGVNVAMFAGHNTLRMLSGIAYDSIPSAQGMAKMEQLLTDALDAGCFGLTTGLEYNPGYYAQHDELNRLAEIVGKKGGISMSHMRNEDDAYVEASIRELLEQGKYCPVHVSHIKVVYGKGEARANRIMQLLDSARQKGIQVTADFYPYTASYTGIAILFPDWAKKPYDYQEALKTRRQELATFLRNKIILRNGPEATLIGSGPYKGKTLKQIAEELNKPFELALMEDIGPYGADGAYFIMDESLQETFLKDKHVMICSDGSPSMRHPRSFGTFARVLETYVVQKQLLSFEEAIHKMTGLSAATIGLHDRGLVKQGYKADLLLFKPEEVRENATYENPHQEATGFRCVLVNGVVEREGGKAASSGMGRLLLK